MMNMKLLAVVTPPSIYQFLFFEENAKEEILSSFQFRDGVQDEVDTLLLPCVTDGNVMVIVRIHSDNCDEC